MKSKHWVSPTPQGEPGERISARWDAQKMERGHVRMYIDIYRIIQISYIYMYVYMYSAIMYSICVGIYI
jgi:hypothetical protein